jgi:hypothetical protein
LEWVSITLVVLSSLLKSRVTLQLENVALRHQIGVLQRSAKKRLPLNNSDRLLWIGLARVWAEWRSALVIVKPDTVIAWHRRAFRMFWSWKIRRGKPGRPAVSREIRDLIRRMCRENPGWGASRIHGEMLKLGIDIGETSVSKYLVRSRKPPSLPLASGRQKYWSKPEAEVNSPTPLRTGSPPVAATFHNRELRFGE